MSAQRLAKKIKIKPRQNWNCPGVAVKEGRVFNQQDREKNRRHTNEDLSSHHYIAAIDHHSHCLMDNYHVHNHSYRKDQDVH